MSGLSRCTVKLEGYYYLASVLPLTGPLASAAVEMDLAVQQAVQEVNGNGGIHEKSLGLIGCDSAIDVPITKSIIQELGQASYVSGLVGPVTSPELLGVVSEVVAAKKVVVSSQASSPAVTTAADDGYIFRTTVPITFEGTTLSAATYRDGLKKVYAVVRSDSSGQANLGAFSAKFTALGGTIESSTIDVNAANAGDLITAAVNKIAAAQPDAVFVVLDPNSATALIRQVKAKTLNPRWVLTSGLISPSFFTALNENTYIDGAIGVTVRGGAAGEAFAAKYKTLWNKNSNYAVTTTYDAAMLLAISMELTTDPDDAPSLRGTLAKTHSGAKVRDWASVLANKTAGEVDYEGASGDANFDAAGDVLAIATKVVFSNGQLTFTDCITNTGDLCP